MTSPLSYLTASIGKKQLMALTGLGLIGFTATHFAGNLLIFFGGDAFNLYAYKLTSNPLIYVAEAGLAGLFFGHIALAVLLRIENRLARPQQYYMKVRTGRGETFASATMPYTGAVLLLFVIFHLLNFKFGTNYPITVDGIEMRDLYRTVIEYFANPLYVAWYVFAMLSFAIHTTHGFQSTFQSIGFNHPKYTPIIQITSVLYGATIGLGFSVMAIYCHFQN